MFTGEPTHVYIRIETPAATGQDGEPLDGQPAQDTQPPVVVEKDPLASTEEEDPDAGFEPRNFTELDRLQWTVYAIENDCHIMPKGAVKLTD